MKITRNILLKVIAVLGVIIILYGLVRQFTGIKIDDTIEKTVFDFVILIAIGLFFYNRKMAQEEKRAKIAKEEAKRQAEENPEEYVSAEDEELPHWERHKNVTEIKNDS